jgi:hypothetical protein
MNFKDKLNNQRARFKTMLEMNRDHGLNWTHNIIGIEPHQALETMLVYGGKVFYPNAAVLPAKDTPFFYGPLKLFVHSSMITLHVMPKYDCRGTIIKPGHIVKVNYPNYDFSRTHVISSDLRNIPGTIVRVLAVSEPAMYLNPKEFDINRINKYTIATELKDSAAGSFTAELHKKYQNSFVKPNFICAFELFYNVTIASEIERKAYYKLLRG